MSFKQPFFSALGTSLGGVVSYSFFKDALAAEKNSTKQYLYTGAGVILSTLTLLNLKKLFSEPVKEKAWVERIEQHEKEEHKDVRSL